MTGEVWPDEVGKAFPKKAESELVNGAGSSGGTNDSRGVSSLQLQPNMLAPTTTKVESTVTDSTRVERLRLASLFESPASPARKEESSGTGSSTVERLRSPSIADR